MSSSPNLSQSPLPPHNRKYFSTDDLPPIPPRPEQPSPAPCQQQVPSCPLPFSILTHTLFSDLILIHALSFLNALDLVQFSRVSKSNFSLERDGGLAKWVLTEARKQQYADVAKTGDLVSEVSSVSELSLLASNNLIVREFCCAVLSPLNSSF